MIGVVAHDAGGAHILASYISRKHLDALIVAQGPAVQVFRERLGRAPDALDFEEVVESVDFVVTGTSWDSTLEWDAIVTARKHEIPSATFLDHWVNYRSRFQRNGVEALPNQIWVGDEVALRKARVEFPDVDISYFPNPYFQDIMDFSSTHSRTHGRETELRILYAGEPISENMHYTEWDAIRYFLENLWAFGRENLQVTMRPHPMEAPDKYDDLIAANSSLALGGQKGLLEELQEHDIVVGCHTMALAVGLFMGLRVVSVIPPGFEPSLIPLDGIEELRLMVDSPASN